VLLADVEAALGAGKRHAEHVRRVATADGEVCVCDLGGAGGGRGSAVSQALSRLTSAGLASFHKEGSWRYYGTSDRADALLSTLDGLRCDDE
jgi:ArsR family transcriptional regulator